MFNFSELRQIHLEITSNCQASCPMCTRNIHGGLPNDLLQLNSWSLEQYKKIIDDSDLDFKKIENFMLHCSEFENRIVILYAEHKSMRKISKITGISYSALRSVKEKIKKFANENTRNNS